MSLGYKIAAYCLEKYGVPLCDKKDTLNIVYMEGANIDGTPNADAIDLWNDVRYIVQFIDGEWKVVFSQFATTEPGRHYTINPINRQGAARIGFGYHPPAWAEGMHKGRHIALVQEAPVRISRDRNRDGKRNRASEQEFMSDPIGINHHSTYKDFERETIGKHSAGCLVGASMEDHITFMQMLRLDVRRLYAESTGEKYLHDCWVIPGDDFAKFKPKQENIMPEKKIKHPVGSEHVIAHTVGKAIAKPRYRVTEISGSLFSSKQTVYLSYIGGGTEFNCAFPSYLAIPLEVFKKDAEPVTEEDVFWV